MDEEMPVEDDEKAEGGEEEEEEEEEEDEDEGFGHSLPPPPMFVSKERRETVAERERFIKEEEDAEEARLHQLEDRKQVSKLMLVDELKREKEEAVKTENSDEEPEMFGEENEVEEFEKWKARELKRIKREKEEREEREKQEEAVNERRGLSDEQIAELDKDKLTRPEKERWRYLQKYYHKGAFFGDDPILQRDVSAPTGEDLIDKSILPSVMQVKNYGKKSRTKWTHLVNEDTTLTKDKNAGGMGVRKDILWDTTNATFISKMGGVGRVDAPRNLGTTTITNHKKRKSRDEE